MAKNYIGGFLFSTLLHVIAIGGFFIASTFVGAKPTEKIVVDLSTLMIEKPPVVEIVQQVTPVAPPAIKPKPKPKKIKKTEPVKTEQKKVKIVEAKNEVMPPQEVITNNVEENIEITHEIGADDNSSHVGETAKTNDMEGENRAELSAKYMDSNFSYIQRRIKKNVTYPTRAKRIGLKGKVFIKFTINDDGTVSDIVVATSCGYKILDEAGVEAVIKSAPFPSPPVSAKIVVPIDFKLM